MPNAIKQFDSDEGGLPVINPFIINGDIISIILMIINQPFQCIIDLMLPDHESRSKTRSIGLRFPSPYDFDHIRERSWRHWKKVDQMSSVLREKDDMSFDATK